MRTNREKQFPSSHRLAMNPSASPLGLILLAFLGTSSLISAQSPPSHFDFSGGKPIKLVWQTEIGPSYYLFQSQDMKEWTYVPTFPQPGTGLAMEYAFTAGALGFFRIIPAPAAPEAFAFIPAGSFLMSDQSTPPRGWANELPAHSVYVSPFYMAKHEVTKALWDSVRVWGLANGYTDLPVGSGKAANHPVHTVSWRAMVKWCNAFSEKSGITPCYTVSGNVLRTGSGTPVCDWTAGGYRLPTEAEWEKAARGGLLGRSFPWGDTISHGQANYCVYSGDGTTNYYSYDLTPRPARPVNNYYHPTYNDGVQPYTSPVGSFSPNGYGLYDMAGNVWEWCWDWYSSSYYSSSLGTDPRGPSTGSARVFRSCPWDGVAKNVRVAYRFGLVGPADSVLDKGGFRLACSVVPRRGPVA
jgi:sulfatase modifying factor 1